MTIPPIADLLENPPVSSGLPRRGRPVTPASSPDRPPKLELRVVWGDLASVPADLHIAGHYQGVIPASAEAALDAAISGERFRQNAGSTARGLIAEHTRRRWLVGELGEVTYFPGRDPQNGSCPVRRAAVIGMGRLGTFADSRADQMFASLLREIAVLADVRTAAMNLIGTGADNLTVPQAARALHRGFKQVVPTLPGTVPLREIALVEIDRLRAEQLLASLNRLALDSPIFVIRQGVEHATGGRVGATSAAVFAVQAIATALQRSCTAGADAAPSGEILAALRPLLPDGLADQVPDALLQLAELDLLSVNISVGRGGPANTPLPTRISVSQRPGLMRWAALTERSTIPEREVPVNPRLVSELVTRLTAPSSSDAQRLPRMLREWIVPSDFQDHVSDTAPLVLELDSASAQLPWEFLTDRAYDNGERPQPLALRTPIARQLRTSYARGSADYAEPSRLRALVIADPGPGQFHLPGADEEGRMVADLLRSRGIDVRLFVGPPGSEPPPGAEPATELDVLTELLVGRYDIVHFAGHATMPDPDIPDQAGWVFADSILSARELSQMRWAPRLVTANACWTAAGLGSTGLTSELQLNARLTAVLADEFLRVGVAHYIGTSWRVPDTMARTFAQSFYERILPTPAAAGMPFGEAVRYGREVLFGMRPQDSSATVQPELWSGWAAYQHYGDPADVLDAFQPSDTPSPGIEPNGDVA